jgi:hypothetical protein
VGRTPDKLGTARGWADCDECAGVVSTEGVVVPVKVPVVRPLGTDVLSNKVVVYFRGVGAVSLVIVETM